METRPSRDNHVELTAAGHAAADDTVRSRNRPHPEPARTDALVPDFGDDNLFSLAPDGSGNLVTNFPARLTARRSYTWLTFRSRAMTNCGQARPQPSRSGAC